MNKLMDLSEWREKRFTGDKKPSLRTCQNWAANGDIPAIKIGRLWFVDIDQQARQTGNPLIDQFLAA